MNRAQAKVVLSAIIATILTSSAPGDWPGRNVIQLDIGLASEIGEGGVTFEHDLSRLFSTEFGVGVGITGPQLSAMAKFYPGPARTFFLGVGLSLATKPELGLDFTGAAPPVIPWLNVDLFGFEDRWDSHHVVFSVSGGTTTALAFGYVLHRGNDFGGDTSFDGLTSLQLRLGVGGWF